MVGKEEASSQRCMPSHGQGGFCNSGMDGNASKCPTGLSICRVNDPYFSPSKLIFPLLIPMLKGRFELRGYTANPFTALGQR